MRTEEFSRLSLSEKADYLDKSINRNVLAKPQSKQMTDKELYDLAEEITASMNPNAPKMTMEEIVQEVRDYRNGK